MCLPAFPFKSPNTSTKVLGRLPDKAEEFALAHLNGLCAAIGDIYAPGARLMIVSDGLVYNDLLGVPDKDVWAYGEALRAIKARGDFRHIEFCRLKDLVHIDVPSELDEIRYVANATNFRHALLKQFGQPDYNVSLKISEDEDTCLTYRGYIKFLETDLQDVYPIGEGRSKSKYKRGIEYIAKQMLMRGDAFARAVRERFPDRLRLSIHPSTGENKIPISLLPTDTPFTTPWHCSIAFRLDGTTTTGHRSEFDADDTFELMYEDSRPSYFREKSDLLSWAAEKGGVKCEPLYPAGLMIKPAAGRNALSIRDVDAIKVRKLSQINSPVLLRDFAHTRKRNLFVEKAREFSALAPQRSAVAFENKDNSVVEDDLGNVPSVERMPFHHDGRYITENRSKEDGSKELIPTSNFELCTALTTQPKDAGYMLSSLPTLISKYTPAHLPPFSLRPQTSPASPPSPDSAATRGLPLLLIADHQTTGHLNLRFYEPRHRSRTGFDATYRTFDNVAAATDGCGQDTDAAEVVDDKSVCDALTSLLRDRRVTYYHAWEKGDLLVCGRFLTMHMPGHSAAGCDQEFWRVCFDCD
ncbi:Pyoverdine/dityrosine biosynthesis protein-domain-containing protein [Hypoxylon sp. NC1633]|nr:Pyoverdine/dityrosine biosynthesis protein-domain-containing protein [Hypoxylon sp. NC1633]